MKPLFESFEEFCLYEDWFDEYLKYVAKVFVELDKRFKLDPLQKQNLETFFGDDLEKGYKKNTPPKKLAFQIIPKGMVPTIHRW